MEYSNACCDVDFILEHLNPKERKKIPENVIRFFKDNKSIFYKTKINSTMPLKQQDISEETKAFLKIIYYKYFADDKQKIEFERILNNEEFEDYLNIKDNIEVIKDEDNIQNKMITYKQNINIFKRIWIWIKKWIRK